MIRRGKCRALFLRNVFSLVLEFERCIQSFSCFRFQEFSFGLSNRHRECRQNTVTELQVQVASSCDLKCIAGRRRNIRKQLAHFAWGSEVLVLTVIAGSTGIGQAPAFMDAHSRLVGVEAIAVQKTNIVCCDDRYRLVARQLQAALHDFFFVGPAAAYEFKIKTIAKYRDPVVKCPRSGFVVAVHDGAANIPRDAAGQCDKAGATGSVQPVAPCQWFAAYLAFDVTSGHQFTEVAVASIVLHQKDQREWVIGVVIIRNAQVQTDNRLNARRNRLAIKLHESEQVVLVRQRNRGHLFFDTTTH